MTVPECGLLLHEELQGHLARRTLLRREKLPSAMRWLMWERWARREGQYSQWGKEEPYPSECRAECPGSGVVWWIQLCWFGGFGSTACVLQGSVGWV